MARFSLHPGCSNRTARQEELKLHSKSIENIEETVFDPEAGKPTDSPFPEDLPNYSSYNVSELKDLCREKELAVSGSKQELIDRLNGLVSPKTPADEAAVEEEEVVLEESTTTEEGDVSESGEENGGTNTE
jgi:hypothetical protein